ncbi:hypothetical protein BKA69DRAFT_1047825 [Paraphysoderma sedebokerense]|nr:hypothetical protein BKA69DRAFT_1047763 [Paraphysoderma sedebokerense]KAI9145475.1 hypothetical protein BKA69DRAFT_1047825 [Paraphysoderma sedebokerense]
MRQLPYDPTALTWVDENHTINQEGRYCYCGNNRKLCLIDWNFLHLECVSNSVSKPLFLGDTFYDFLCAVCNNGNEIYSRVTMSWASAVHLALYNLTERYKNENIRDQYYSNDRQFFRWKEDICEFIDQHFSLMFPGRVRSGTWQNTIAGVLSSNQKILFQSGAEIFGMPAFWALIVDGPPQRGAPKLKKTGVGGSKKRTNNSGESSGSKKSSKTTKKQRKLKTPPSGSKVSSDPSILSPSSTSNSNHPADSIQAPPPPLPLSTQQEWDLLQSIESIQTPLPPYLARLRRRLKLRQIKRCQNLELFDVDAFVKRYLDSEHPLTLLPPSLNFKPVTIPRISTNTPASSPFQALLLGSENQRDVGTNLQWTSSPFSGRRLKPFIRRDWEGSTVKMRVLEELKARGKESERRLCQAETQHHMDISLDTMEKTPIDYVYLQEKHIPQVNQLLQRNFWPGIDVSESLLFPEFSIVALYKHLVIGCALMTPEGYISYIAVSKGWEGTGIGKFMVWWLCQSLPSKDITLHVSANNPAMILYQKFGFKCESFIVHFYDRYLPSDSTECKNAFFLRLRQ